ncbi:hypothetical protein D3C87_1955860 [compost metagenome]
MMSTTRFNMTRKNTIKSRYATTTGRSRLMIESISSLPMPGHENTVSVTTANAITWPNSRPATVTTGIRMFFNRCTPSTRFSDRPLARANLM